MEDKTKSPSSPTVIVEVIGNLISVLTNKTANPDKGPYANPQTKAGISSKWKDKKLGNSGMLKVKNGTQ